MWEEPDPEKQEAIIKKMAEFIYKYDMDLGAILLLEVIKPFSSIGSQLARYMVAPFIPFIGEESMPYFATFENKQNVEKLIRMIEERSMDDERKRKEEEDRVGITPRRGWRRFFKL
jgi:hypothetical protein